jgi:serine/threonine protein phosphatase PrpC
MKEWFMEAASISLCNPGKTRCGDACRFQPIDGGNLLIACVADGVSGAACDWLASRLTVDTFIDTFCVSPAGPVQDRFSQAVYAANNRVLDEIAKKGARMLSTLIATVWDRKMNTLYYTSVGDSRIYGIESSGMRQITNDETQPVIMRGSGGKLFISEGAIVVRTGLTNAIGTPELACSIQRISSEGLFAVIMASDGFYGCESFRSQDIVDLCNQVYLQTAFDAFGQRVHDTQRDDATAVIVRNETVSEEVRQQVLLIAKANEDFRGKGFFAYSVAKTLLDEISCCIREQRKAGVFSLLEYADRYRIDFGRKCLISLADLAGKPEHADKSVLGSVVERIRSSRNP